MRTFEHFPQGRKACPVCGTSDDKPCTLIPIDNTGDDRICEAVPVHVDCLSDNQIMQYNRNVNIIYIRCKEPE